MLKGKKVEEPVEKTEETGNGSNNSEVAQILKSLIEQQKEMIERLEDLEKKRNSSGEAHLRMVNFLYDTDDKHLPELTILPIQACRPHALGMTLEAILDPEVQALDIPLSRVLRNSYFRLLRSRGGIHLGRGVRLAEEQAAAEAEKEEELEMGAD